MLVLGEMRQAHPPQHVGGLRELDVVIADDLYARRLPAALLQCNELVAQIDEGRGLALTAQLEG
jgi:hypothetical protein